MAEPCLRLVDVRRSFDSTRAVDGLSLAVAAGEYVSLLGPSGSGKSTTLGLIAGFLRPDGGEIWLDGRLLGEMPAHRRGIGVVFQEPRLLPHLTVAENVGFPLAMRRVGRAERDRAIRAALAMVDLAGLAERRPDTLSGGQAQRVALAAALVFKPSLVLLDEPLGALDRQLREAMQGELRALQQRTGIAMLHVTHDQAEAMAVSDRMAVIEAGQLRQVGTPRALYDAPANVFVARFLGEDNQIPGRVAAVEDDIAVVRLPGGALVEARDTGVAVGGNCVISVRPERLAVAAIAAEEMGDGALPAVLREVAFRGDHVRLTLEAAGTTVLVKRPAIAPLAGFVPGADLALAWQPHHAQALPV